jgi:hypothetical protein
MTEKKWLSARAVIDLHIYYSAKKQFRKWRLFGCACARRVLHIIPDERFRIGVDASEQLADEELTWDNLKLIRKSIVAARRKVIKSGGQFEHTSAVETVLNASEKDPGNAMMKAWSSASGVYGTLAQPDFEKGYVAENQYQVRLARDIFGNPFRPMTFEPDWRTSTAVALAKQMYDSRDFSAMPILADALQDTGCDNDDILNHCRDEKQVHVRGCWVVDLVLGKS